MSDEGILRAPMFPWRELRSAGPENSATAANILTGFTYNDQKANCVDLYELFEKKFTGLFVAMYGDSFNGQTCDDNDTFGFDLIGYRKPLGNLPANGYNPALLICSAATASAKVGTRRASGDGGVTETGRWVDEITLTNDEWSDGINRYTNGNNSMLQLEFNANGIRYLYPYVWDALGAQAGECPAVGMIITAY